jgi:hypothetical protein
MAVIVAMQPALLAAQQQQRQQGQPFGKQHVLSPAGGWPVVSRQGASVWQGEGHQLSTAALDATAQECSVHWRPAGGCLPHTEVYCSVSCCVC